MTRPAYKTSRNTVVRMSASSLTICLLTLTLLASSSASAQDCTFSIEIGNDPSNAAGWASQAGVVTDHDFESHEHLTNIASDGGVSLSLGGLGGASDTVRVFQSNSFNTQGTLFQKALLNYDASGAKHSKMVFDFDAPVRGAGAFVFDDGSTTMSAFRIVAVDADGVECTSPVLDADNGTDAAVEGFIGVSSPRGIVSMSIEVLDADPSSPNHLQPALYPFELDHLMVGSPACTFSVEAGNDPHNAADLSDIIGAATDHDFESHEHLTNIASDGGVSLSLGGLGGASDTVRVFQSNSFATQGTLFQKALLNYDASGAKHSKMVFDFDAPVRGAGAFVFDDGSTTMSAFRIVAVDADGVECTSPVLDADNGTDAAVEGFIGVSSPRGIVSMSIEVLDADPSSPNHLQPALYPFELDHLMVGMAASEAQNDTNPSTDDTYNPIPALLSFETVVGEPVLMLDTNGSTVSWSEGTLSVVGDVALVDANGALLVALPGASLTLSIDDSDVITNFQGTVELPMPESDTLDILTLSGGDSVSVNYTLGSNLTGGPGTLAVDRHYFAFSLSTGLTAELGPLSISTPNDTSVDFILDPHEPYFYFNDGNVGLEFSAEGRVPFEASQTWGLDGIDTDFNGHFRMEGSLNLPGLSNTSMDTTMVVRDESNKVRFGANGDVSVGMEIAPQVELSIPLGGATVGGDIPKDSEHTRIFFSGTLGSGFDFLPGELNVSAGLKVAGLLDTGNTCNSFIKLNTALTIEGQELGNATIRVNRSGTMVTATVDLLPSEAREFVNGVADVARDVLAAATKEEVITETNIDTTIHVEFWFPHPGEPLLRCPRGTQGGDYNGELMIEETAEALRNNQLLAVAGQAGGVANDSIDAFKRALTDSVNIANDSIDAIDTATQDTLDDANTATTALGAEFLSFAGNMSISLSEGFSDIGLGLMSLGGLSFDGLNLGGFEGLGGLSGLNNLSGMWGTDD